MDNDEMYQAKNLALLFTVGLFIVGFSTLLDLVLP